jgi:hypothetical protein
LVEFWDRRQLFLPPVADPEGLEIQIVAMAASRKKELTVIK